MPTVPKSPIGRVGLDPLPGVRLTAAETPESEGAGIAEAQGQIAGALAGVGAKTAALGEEQFARELEQGRRQGNEIAVLNGTQQLGQHRVRLATDALSKRGQAAAGLPEKVMDDFNTAADGIEAGLSNPEQRLAFRRVRQSMGLSLNEVVSTHTASQVQQYQGQELEASVTNSRQFAVLNSDKAPLVNQEMASQEAMIRMHAPDLGYGPEELKKQITAARSATLVDVIEDQLAKGKTQTAQLWFEERKGEIAAEQIPRLEKALKEGDNRGEAQRQSDAIYAAGGSEREQLEKARQIDDPDVRDKTTTYLTQRHERDKRLQREDDEKAGDAGSKILIATGGDLTKIPPSTWKSASGRQQEAWLALSEHLAKGTPVETNLATYDVLERLATSHDPDERRNFAEMNLQPFAGLLSKSDMIKVLDWQGASRKGDFEKVATLTASESVVRQIVDGNLVGLGVNPNPPAPGKDGYDKQASERVVTYRRAVRDAVAAREAVTKKKLTEPEVQDIADTLMAQTAAEKTHWFSANEPARYAFEMPDAGVTRSSDVPASERTQIEAALKKAGLPISETAIVMLFNAHLQAVRGKTR